MELMTVIVVIVILVALLMPAVGMVRKRVEKVRCMSNLRGLHAGAHAYVQEKGQWPQISTVLIRDKKREYDKLWIEALAPYGIARKVWICPTIQREMGAPDFEKEGRERCDYVPMPFDSGKDTPYKWAKQPWFAERGDVHGRGQLVILTDGGTHDLKDLIPKK
jgi:type II secretory pathway pseudopilin PulG